jgi:hypothetical protein
MGALRALNRTRPGGGRGGPKSKEEKLRLEILVSGAIAPLPDFEVLLRL